MTTTDLYVSTTGSDSNSGTQSSPFKTILKASQAAQPGTTVHVAAGTYYGGFSNTAPRTAPAPPPHFSGTQKGGPIRAGGEITRERLGETPPPPHHSWFSRRPVPPPP